MYSDILLYVTKEDLAATWWGSW